MKVWRIISGPYHRDEIEGPVPPEDLEYMLVCLVEYNGGLFDQELWFETFEETQIWVKHFKSKIEPIEINDEALSDTGEM